MATNQTHYSLKFAEEFGLRLMNGSVVQNKKNILNFIMSIYNHKANFRLLYHDTSIQLQFTHAALLRIRRPTPSGDCIRRVLLSRQQPRR